VTQKVIKAYAQPHGTVFFAGPSIKEVLKIYFSDPLVSWQQYYNGFLNAIHNAGYPNFRDIFTLDPNPTLEEVFKQECIDNFGREFLDILESPRRSLDYGKILP